MKRTFIKIVVILIAVCLVTVFVAPLLFRFPVIGRVYGSENQFIEIDGAEYVRTMDRPYTSADRGSYLGAVKNEKITMRAFNVKGDESGQWLFALWDWEGYFYRRVHEE